MLVPQGPAVARAVSGKFLTMQREHASDQVYSLPFRPFTAAAHLVVRHSCK